MNRTTRPSTALAMALTVMGASPAFADMDAARAFLDEHIGELSALTREEQEAEMQWFIDAAAPHAGMSINVVSETITTHEWESNVLAPAFSAITGIEVTHTLIGEGDVVDDHRHRGDAHADRRGRRGRAAADADADRRERL